MLPLLNNGFFYIDLRLIRFFLVLWGYPGSLKWRISVTLIKLINIPLHAHKPYHVVFIYLKCCGAVPKKVPPAAARETFRIAAVKLESSAQYGTVPVPIIQQVVAN